MVWRLSSKSCIMQRIFAQPLFGQAYWLEINASPGGGTVALFVIMYLRHKLSSVLEDENQLGLHLQQLGIFLIDTQALHVCVITFFLGFTFCYWCILACPEDSCSWRIPTLFKSKQIGWELNFVFSVSQGHFFCVWQTLTCWCGYYRVFIKAQRTLP